MLSRSDDPEWGVAALCCHRPPGTTRLSRSWRFSLTPTREVMAHPSVWLSQRACCLKKLFTCQGTPCRRGQTVTGSGTGRAFRFGSPSQHTTDIFSRKLGTAGEKISENRSTLLSESAPVFVPMLCPFTLQRTIILRIRGCSFRKISLSTFQRTEICRLLSMPVRKFFLREPVSAQVIFKTLRSDRACKALSLGEVAAAVRLRIAGFGEGTPQQDSDGTE